MTRPLCVVWACARVADGDGETFCARHAPESALADQGAEDGWSLVYVMAEGLTLAEVAALTV